MNTSYLPVTEDELHAYIDGELAADRIAAVETWLASHPDDMAKVAAWRAQGDAIRARYGAVADEPVPARFDLAQLMRTDTSWRQKAAIAAAIAFIAGGAIGWLAHIPVMTSAQATNFNAFTAEAVEAYKLYVVEVRHPVEVTANDADHLVQWLSKRVGYQLNAPNLENVGLKLVGGRLLPGPTGAAAFFMYENAAGERYTLYCGRSNVPETSLRYADSAQGNSVYWANREITYVINGKGNRKDLHNVAIAAYEQLETPAQKGGG
jgi:anti-sigma factor RsiW